MNFLTIINLDENKIYIQGYLRNMPFGAILPGSLFIREPYHYLEIDTLISIDEELYTNVYSSKNHCFILTGISSSQFF